MGNWNREYPLPRTSAMEHEIQRVLAGPPIEQPAQVPSGRVVGSRILPVVKMVRAILEPLPERQRRLAAGRLGVSLVR